MPRESKQFRNTTYEDSVRFTDNESWSEISGYIGKGERWKKEAIIENSAYTVTDNKTMLDLINSVEHVMRANIPGDLVECGVYMGGSSRLMMKAMMMHNHRRNVWMYDTYEGVPLPADDELLPDQSSLKDWYVENKTDMEGNSTWCYSSIDDVKANIGTLGYTGQVFYVRGKVEDTIPDIMPNEIAILRVDVDLVEPTRHILSHLLPRISKGGHIILDDYGYFPKVKEMVDELLPMHHVNIVNRTVGHIVL